MQTKLWSPSIGDTPPAIIAAPYNLTATVDPGPSNDNTQGYSVGSWWFNATAGYLRLWECRNAATGAAAWVFSGADYANGGTNPNIEVTQFGSGASLMAEEGNINRQVFGTAVNPGGTGVDSVLAVYSLPANSFDISGRGINITAQGSFAATGNNKRIKLIFNATTAVVGSAVTGGTTVADTGVVTTSGGGWCIEANVYKYGAAGSNTQQGLHQQAQVGAAVSAMLAPSFMTATESGPILVCATGNATTAVSDIALTFWEVNALN